MPRLFNAEKCLFETFAVDSMDSDATETATFTGVTTDDYVFVMQFNDLTATTQSGMDCAISAANTIVVTPTGASGAGTALAQTVGVVVMVNPTSGQEGGSW